MACVNPMVRIVDPDGTVHIRSAFGFDPHMQSAINPKWSYIPCGHCDGCRAQRSKEWADRMMIESQFHDHSWFVTLTFNDEALKKHGRSLDVRDLQLFIKRLRRDTRQKLRYFACGEYGDLNKTFRCHYHLIIFGLDLPDNDRVYLRSNKLNQSYYSSSIISKAWSDPDTGESYGFNVVGKVDYESCRYTARYIQKKLNGPDKLLYEYMGVKEPFCVMSRRPGIAAWYLDDNPDWWKKSKIYIETDNGSRTCLAPKYFERKLEVSDPDLHEERKVLRRQFADMSEENILAQTDKDKWSYAKTVESNIKKSLDVLTSFEKL